MKFNKIMLAMIAMTSIGTQAQEIKINEMPHSSISPQICEMSYAAKVPFCTIEVETTEGTVLQTAFFEHSSNPNYEDTNDLTLGELHSTTKKFESNPIALTFDKDSKKQIRLMYMGKIDPTMQQNEIYGRFVLQLTKNGSPQTTSLPVFFTTAKGEKFEVSKASVRVTGEFAGFRYPNGLTTISVTNTGNGVLAIKGIGFTKKAQNEYQDNDFSVLSANVMPHSTAIIPVYDQATAAKLKNATSVILSNKRKTEYVEVAIVK